MVLNNDMIILICSQDKGQNDYASLPEGLHPYIPIHPPPSTGAKSPKSPPLQR